MSVNVERNAQLLRCNKHLPMEISIPATIMANSLYELFFLSLALSPMAQDRAKLMKQFPDHFPAPQESKWCKHVAACGERTEPGPQVSSTQCEDDYSCRNDAF